MEDIYDSYLTGEEREKAIEESSMELLFNKLDMMYEMSEMEYQNDIQSAEFKVLKESGTYDDLQYLIEVATEENNEKKKGIIKSLLDAIVSLFKKVSDAIRKFTIKGNAEEEADVPDDFIKKHNAIMDFWNKWRNAIPNIIKGEKQSGDGIIAAVEAAIALGTVGGTTAVVVRKIKLSKMQEYKNNEETVSSGLTDKITTLQSAIDTAQILTGNNQNDEKSKNGILDFIKKILGKLKDFANFVKSTFNQLVNIIQTKFKSTKSGKSDNNSNDNESKENNQTDKNQANKSTDNTNSDNESQANNQSNNTNGNNKSPNQQTQSQPVQNQNNSQKTIIFTKISGNNLSENDIGKEYKIKVNNGKKKKRWVKQGTITKDMVDNKTFVGKSLMIGNVQESSELEDIFGLNLINEMAQYESDETDKDMEELSNLFESLF